ncbi:MAG: T9SS type A sorting domain-containing protein, partial [Crocinitomicaceae bacterium]
NDVTISANNLNADTYQWIDCLNGNAIVPGATNASFSPTSNGEYAVIITENGCTDTSACTVVSVIGLTEFDHLNFTIYPNPTTGEITLSYDAMESSVRIEVSNLLGQIVHNKTLYNTQNISLNIPGESGVYTVRVFDSSGVHSHKIIKREEE